jgi:hypothetical protein
MPRSQSSKQVYVGGSKPTYQPAVISQKSASPSFGQALKQGFGFGLGNSIANFFMGSLFSSNKTYPITTIEPDVQASRSIGASATQDMSGQIEYLQCIKEGGTEEICKQYMS